MDEADSITAKLSVTHLFYTVQDLFSKAGQSRFQNSFHTLLFVFLVDLVLASQINTEEETLWVKQTPLQVSCQSPISFTQFKTCSVQQGSPDSKQFSHTSLCFFGRLSLSIPDQYWGRDFMGEADSITGQLLVTHLFYTVQDLFSARQSSFQNSFHTLLFVFWWTRP